MADQRRTTRRSRVLAVAAAMTLAAGMSLLSPAAASATHGHGHGHGHHGHGTRHNQSFPPKANSAWVYDTTSPGTWTGAIAAYNARAGSRHQINQVYSYGTDMEMYCPDNDGTRCTADDLYSFYTAGSDGPARTAAYYNAFAASDRNFTISPIIDGRTDANGYLRGFNELSPSLAAGFADKVAAQVCADPHVDGIQFDLEPFDVSTKNGQYYFYLQLAKDFAGRHAGSRAHDPYGCVDSAHPHGRFYSVFTFAEAIRPGTESASNVRDILSTYGNGYLMDSLYDLSKAPAGTLNSVTDYTTAAKVEARHTERWAHRLHIHYGFGIPASASAHEFTTCTEGTGAVGNCVSDASGATGHPMLSYTRAAVSAIRATGAVHDPRYIGTSIWDFGDDVSWNGLSFGPVPASGQVLDFLATSLPGSTNPGRARGPHH